MSKFSVDVLNKYVYPYFKINDPDVVLGSEFGEDVALTRVGSDLLVSHLDPIIGAVKNIGWLAVHVACNDIATSGAAPRWIQLLVIVPSEKDVDILHQIMQDVGAAAEEAGVSIIGGHTGYSASLNRPLVSVTALGTLHNQAPVLTKGAQVGDQILVTKGVALEGTAILAHDFSQTALGLGLTEADLEGARDLMKHVSIIPEGVLLGQSGAHAMHDVTRGGLMETLLEIASLSGVGMRIDASRIHVPEIVQRFAAAFQFDPLRMISSGTLVATVPSERLEEATSGLKAKGVNYAVIGEVTAGSGVHLHDASGTTSYHEIRCEEDELARMWTLHQPD